MALPTRHVPADCLHARRKPLRNPFRACVGMAALVAANGWPSPVAFACRQPPLLGRFPQSLVRSARHEIAWTAKPQGHKGQHSPRPPLTACPCGEGKALAELVAEPDVEKLGIRFVSLPPGKVIVKQATLGMWAAGQGVTVGAELSTINGRQVANMTREDFMRAIGERPLRMELMQDPRRLTSELTMTSSASSVLSVISPWVGGPHFNQIHVATAIYRLAVHEADFTDDVRNSPVFKSLVGRAKRALEMNEVEPRPLSNIFWAVAKLSPYASWFDDLFPVLACAARLRVVEMGVRDACNVFWAIASLREAAPRLIELISPVAACLLEHRLDMRTQDVSNSFWSAAVLRRERPDLQEFARALAEIATEQAPRMTPQHIANIVWGAGLLRLDGEHVPRMLAALRQEAVAQLDGFNAQNVANACHGLVVLGSLDEPFMSSVLTVVVKNEKRWTRKDIMYGLTLITWASARIGFGSAPLLEFVALKLTPHVGRLNNWGLSALVWSYVKLDSTNLHMEFRQALKAEAFKRGLDGKTVSRARLGPEEWDGQE